MPSHPSYIHDRPATVDSLGRVTFADALSHSLVLPKGSPGLVVGIEGNWGSGKSTLIGFVIKSLSKTTAGGVPIIVEFNPWMVSNTGAIVEALIGQVAVSIGKNFSEGKKGIAASQKLLGYVGLLKSLKYVPGLSWAGHAAEDIPNIWQAVASTAEQGTKAGQKALDDFGKLLPSLDLTQRRTEVVAALEELDRPIVIVIDDLDRLPAEEIRAMIQAIKAVADFPRITYLLAYDRNIVACALGADKESGLSYLEKIVQVAYPIPPLSQRQLRQFANDKVQVLLDSLHIKLRDFEERRYEEALTLLTKLVRHPRDVVRVVNRLTLSLPATGRGVNAADIIVFEALSLRFPDLREAIRIHSADFIKNFFRDDQIDGDSGETDWMEYYETKDTDNSEPPWLKHLPIVELDRRISKKACLFLFTLQEQGGNRVVAEDYLGLADPDRLARLFRMTSLEDVPEVEEFHELLQHPEILQETLQVDEEEQLRFLLEWLINYTPSCTTPDVVGSINCLVAVSLQLMSQCRLTDNLANKFSDLVERLLRSKATGYEDGFLNIAQNAPLSVSENIVFRAVLESGKLAGRANRREKEDCQLIAKGDLVDQAKNIWIKRVEKYVAIDNLYRESNLIGILHCYTQFNHDAFVKTHDVISKMCATDEGLAAFLTHFVQESPFLKEQLVFVENAEDLAVRIINSTLKDEYFWLVEYLRREEIGMHIQKQQAKNLEAQELEKEIKGGAL